MCLHVKKNLQKRWGSRSSDFLLLLAGVAQLLS